MEVSRMICPMCQAEPCFLSCEIPAYLKHSQAELQEEYDTLQEKYKAAMERIVELSRTS